MPQSAARAAAHASAAKDRSSLYEEITNKIIAELEAGRLPWVQPWGSSHVRAPLGMPKNAATGRTYSGINVLILWDRRRRAGLLHAELADFQAGPGDRARGIGSIQGG